MAQDLVRRLGCVEKKERVISQPKEDDYFQSGRSVEGTDSCGNSTDGESGSGNKGSAQEGWSALVITPTDHVITHDTQWYRQVVRGQGTGKYDQQYGKTRTRQGWKRGGGWAWLGTIKVGRLNLG